MTDEQRTRVAVISPQPVVVAGITAVLSRHRARIAMVPAPTAQAVPDVVLYDVLGLADGRSDELGDLLDQTAAVLAIRRDQRPELLSQALARGADGCVDLSIGDLALLAALDAARARKRRPTTSSGAIVCACPTPQASRMGVGVGLSAQEAEILAAVAQGLTNVEIAERDFRSINTVKTYIRSSYRKIGVQTRSQAVAWVLRHGFDAAAADDVEVPAP